MADNVTFQTTVATPPSGTIVATDNVGGFDYQRCKLVWGVDGVVTDASAVAPLPVTPGRAATTAFTTIVAANADTSILAANANRLGATIQNDSNNQCYLFLTSAAAAASSTTYTVLMPPASYYEVPFSYTDKIRGFWTNSPTVSGSARITEITA